MKILKHGCKHPQYIGKCENCGCEVLCEANEIGNDIKGNKIVICPECNAVIEEMERDC